MTAQALSTLLARAHELPLVTLVGLVERMLGASADGGEGTPPREVVRFHHDPGLGFHASDVLDAQLVDDGAGGTAVAITTGVLGLTGASSPLPLSWIEQLAHAGEPRTEGAFLDLFHHRLLGLLCRGLARLDLGRSGADSGAALLAHWSLLLAGLDPAHAPRVTQLALSELLWLGPLLVSWPPSARRLEVAIDALLDDALGAARGETRVYVREWTGGDLVLAPSERPRLGSDLRLGAGSVLGARLAAPASGLTVEIGPLSAHGCRLLAPTSELGKRCAAVVALLTPETVHAVIELRPGRTAGLRLGRGADVALGRASWLGRGGRPEPVRFHAC